MTILQAINTVFKLPSDMDTKILRIKYLKKSIEFQTQMGRFLFNFGRGKFEVLDLDNKFQHHNAKVDFIIGYFKRTQRFYTKKDIINKRISFYPMPQEVYEKICGLFGEEPHEYNPQDFYRFYPHLGHPDKGHSNSMGSYLEAGVNTKSTEEITFQEFLFEG